MKITCCHGYRMQDAVRLVHLFNVVHPQSESAQQAQRQQAAGLDLLKVSTQYILGPQWFFVHINSTSLTVTTHLN